MYRREQDRQTNSSQQLPSSSPGSGDRPATTSEAVSHGADATSEPYVVDGAGLVPSDLKNWASPEEVLQLRAVWDETQRKHKAEYQLLRQQLSECERERNLLRVEVKETERLREQYRVARTAFNTVQVERNQWQEEREMLMLRLQRMANEIDRLRDQASLLSSNGGGSGSGGFPSSSLGHPATGSSTAGSSTGASLLHADTEEIVRMLEQQNRLQLTITHMEQRLELHAVVSRFEISRHERQHLVLVAENEQLKNRQRVIEDGEEQTRRTLRFAQQEVRSLQDEVERLKHEMNAASIRRTQESMDQEREWERVWKEDVADKERLWRGVEDDLRFQLHEVNEANEDLKKKNEELRRQRERYTDDHTAEVDALAEQLRAAEKKSHELELAASDAENRYTEQCRVAANEVALLTRARDTAVRNSQVHAAKVDELSSELHDLRLQHEQQGLEASKLRALVAQLAKDNDLAKLLEAERDTYRGRAIGFEEEIAVQREFYEKQMRVLHQALLTLQHQKRSENDVMLKEMVALRQRQAKVVEKKRKKEDRKSATEGGDAAPDASSPRHEIAPALDPLQLLRETKQLADRLEGNVQKSDFTN